MSVAAAEDTGMAHWLAYGVLPVPALAPVFTVAVEGSYTVVPVPQKFPCRIAAVATVAKPLFDLRIRVNSSLTKKKSLFLLTGPPIVYPNWLKILLGSFGCTIAVLKYVRAL